MNLVREYVSCMDEISQIYDISVQKIELLGKLREHCEILERQNFDDTSYSRLNQDDHLLSARIDGAVKQIKKDNENLPRLLNDLKASLDVVMIPNLYAKLSPDRIATALPTTDNRTERTCYHCRV